MFIFQSASIGPSSSHRNQWFLNGSHPSSRQLVSAGTISSTVPFAQTLTDRVRFKTSPSPFGGLDDKGTPSHHPFLIGISIDKLSIFGCVACFHFHPLPWPQVDVDGPATTGQLRRKALLLPAVAHQDRQIDPSQWLLRAVQQSP